MNNDTLNPKLHTNIETEAVNEKKNQELHVVDIQ